MDRHFSHLVDMQKKSCQRYANKNLYASKQKNQYEWMSYQALDQAVVRLQSHLHNDIQPLDHIAIISPNSVEWVMIAYAGLGLGAAITPMYASQHPDEWIYILNDCQISRCFVANNTILNTLIERQHELPHIKEFILTNGIFIGLILMVIDFVNHLMSSPTRN